MTSLHPDRLLPVGPGTRSIARDLYRHIREAPIVSPHGHVDPQLLLRDEPFADPVSLFVTPDHYVTRLLHASGVRLDELGVGRREEPLPETQARRAWRLLCEHWSVFAGTPVRYWLQEELAAIFDVTEVLAADNADAIYDRIAERLPTPDYRPRRMFVRFGIEVLATTDDPCDDLAAHSALAADPGFSGRVIPTFRPDRYLEPGPDWPQLMGNLGAAAEQDTGTYGGYVAALAARRRYFAAHGATSTDHSHLDARTDPLDESAATGIYAAAIREPVPAVDAAAFRRHMLHEMARMSCADGLVMTLHPGICRDHHADTARRYGPDTGHDIPVRIEFTRALRPLLQSFGTDPNLHVVLFTVDESAFSREIAPLAGFYPSVYAGAPWWFLDAPDAIRRYRAAVTETIGFSRTSGFVDDTRALCSIPVRHDMARRLDAGYLAGLVADHRLDEDEAADIARRLIGPQPRAVFKLGPPE
jgi:glucuronate isomerase